MIPFRKSLGFRLLGLSFILLGLPLLIDSFILVKTRYQNTMEKAREHLIAVSRLRHLPLSQLQFLNRSIIEFLADYLNIEKEFPQNESKELDNQLKKIAEIGGFSDVSLIQITPEQRYIVVDSGNPSGIGKNYTDFFKLNHIGEAATLEKGFSGYVSFEKETLRPIFMIARTIYSFKKGRVVGVLTISDDVADRLHNLLRADTKNYKVDFALLLPSTIVFAATDPNLRFHYFLPLNHDYKALFSQAEPEAAQFLSREPLPVTNEENFPFFGFYWNGREQIGYITRPPGANYELLTYAAKEDIFQTPLIEFFNLYTIYGMILVIGGTIATLLTMRMAQPIQNLSSVMEKIQRGDLTNRYQQDPLGFEINTLGTVFNNMIDAVLSQKRIAEEERVKREVYAQELRLGREAQRSLFPKKMPEYPGIELAEKYIPAIEVGGDFYDAFVKGEGTQNSQLVLAIADASGKGVQACFYSLSLRNMLRTYAKEHSDIAQAMFAANELFRKDTEESGMFVTALAGIYDWRTKIFHYNSCGHNPGLIRRKNGNVEVLETTGIALGVFPLKPTISHIIQLETGDSVIFYTDGITEAHDEKFQFFGEGRLIQCLEKSEGKSASDIVQTIIDHVNVFVGTAPQHDDITLLVMKIHDKGRS